VKIFIVTLVWGIVGVLLPATASSHEGSPWISLPALIWFFVFCTMIFSLTITFDIRDYFYDGEKLKTIPALVGIKKAIGISLFSLVIFAAGVLFLHWQFSTGTTFQLITIFFWCVIAAIFIVKSNPSRNDYYFSFFIDGLLILLWVFIFLADRV
jgi:4-hydroxybenzoate polyprenyltransferase